MATSFCDQNVDSRSRLIVQLGRAGLVLALLLLILVALYLAADAEGFGGGYAIYYPYVFVGAALALLLLAGAIVLRLRRLQRQLRTGVPGARMARRLVVLLLVLALPPVLLVYGFGVRFVAATVDSWLLANAPAALDGALTLARRDLDQRGGAALAELASLGAELRDLDNDAVALALERALDQSSAQQLAVFDGQGRLRALAATDPAWAKSQPPDDPIRLAAAASGRSVTVEGDGDSLSLRALYRIDAATERRPRLLQSIQVLPADFAGPLQDVERAVAEVRQARFLRESLKLAFVLILTFVLLISVLLAILAAFDLARRLVAPIARLSAATRAVAAGRYDSELPEGEEDELGFLVSSFNRMQRELAQSTSRARISAEETERQREFLETVMRRLSSGVLIVAIDGTLKHANPAVDALLGDPLQQRIGTPLTELRRLLPECANLFDLLLSRLHDGSREFREECALPRSGEAQLLLVRGARLPDEGLVAVFDDTTAIDRTRRDAAWGEVARRLAHEVKNPLTPIQLSAERLRRRVLPHLAPEQARVLDRATHTIVAQVEALKTLVNAFGEYARAPALQREQVNLAALVHDVIELYGDDGGIRLSAVIEESLPDVTADAGRLRQVLHNLIKNAQEAAGAGTIVQVDIRARRCLARGRDWIELVVEDNGPGLPEGFDAGWFDPYRTTKPRGTGLGLAVVRKIAEEHGGQLSASNRLGGGASFAFSLPV